MIYFIQEEAGPIKIGHVKDDSALMLGSIRARASALQIGNPRELRVVAYMAGTLANEQELHGRFAEHRLRGEWFKPAEELLRYVKANAMPFPAWESPWEHAEDSAPCCLPAYEPSWVVELKQSLFPNKFAQTTALAFP